MFFTKILRVGIVLLLSSVCLIIFGCGAPANLAPQPVVDVISISPAKVALQAGNTVQFRAVLAAGREGKDLQWRANGILGGNSAQGTISRTGLYTAPQGVGLHGRAVLISVGSQTEMTPSSSAVVALLPAAAPVTVAISPTIASLYPNQIQQFSATVGGTANHAIRWFVNGDTGGNSSVGTISSTGVYTAPQNPPAAPSVAVSAISAYDTASSVTAAVTILSAPADTGSGTSAPSSAYYVDASAGSDSNNGRSPTTAWRTIAKVNASGFSPGEQILFKRGETWREQLDVPSAGAPGNPIIFGAYGTGDPPRITGADVLANSGWSPVSPHTYSKVLTVDPGNWVLENGMLLTRVFSITSVEVTAGSFYWTSTMLYLHTSDSSSPNSNAKTYETPSRAYGATIWGGPSGRAYITFDSLDLEMVTRFCVGADKASHFTIRNSILRYSGMYGIWVSDDRKTDDMLVDSDTFSDIAGAGALIEGDNATFVNNTFLRVTRALEVRDNANLHSRNFLIQNNNFLNCGSNSETNAGVLIDGDTNSSNSDYNQGTVRYNHFSGLFGRPIDGFYGLTEISYNIIENTMAGAPGSDVAIEVNGPGNKVYGNTVVNSTNIAIMVNSDPVAGNIATEVKNNISYSNNGITKHLIYVASGVTVNPVLSNNLYYDAAGGTGTAKYFWRVRDYAFNVWKDQSGEASSSREQDPKFANAVAGDYRLTSASPAVDGGANLGNQFKNALSPASSTFPFLTVDQSSASSVWGIGAFAYIP